MRTVIALFLVVLVLLPVIAVAQGSGQKKDSLEARLKYAHESVRFWWSVYIQDQTYKSYRKLTQWRIECTLLMQLAEKK